ncbi:MAG: HlyD family type I secretion periplasmic adaptor subunit [Rickettsiales bacterium]|nr:HlyD family type I secretion periplasmic adaptor subunit [Rickettsiales bacterium]
MVNPPNERPEDDETFTHDDDSIESADDAQGEVMPLDESDDQGKEASDSAENLPATSGNRQVDKVVSRFQEVVAKASNRIDEMADYVAPRNLEEEQAPENISRSAIVFGMVMFIAIFGIFGLWSVIAPIDSAAIASGKVSLDQNKKTIEHLEGGIIEEIMVVEGQNVEEGQPLVRLDDTASKARMELYRGKYIAALAAEARLKAERDGMDTIDFPQELLEKESDNTDVQTNLDSQRRLFATRREAISGKTDVLNQKIKQSEEEIKGLKEQITSADRQIKLLSEEIRDVKFLLKTGNAPKTRLLSLERRLAEIRGERGRDQALISRANQSINETKIEKFNLKTDMLNQVVADLKETQGELSDLEEQLRAAEDVTDRVLIKAPIAGQVTGLNVHTIGEVIAPNEELMSIVPFDDKLIVEAQIQPQDIDIVRTGLRARVRLLAYKVRNVPPVEGTVVTVSADRFEDERTGGSFFIARIEIDEEQLKKLDNVELSPGMPTEALIVTGSRSLFSYLMSPISDSFNRALREQ